MLQYFFKTLLFASRFWRKALRVSNLYVAKSQGLIIGKSTYLVGNQDFGSEPYLVSIGENCLITDGVKFITHDGAIQVPFIANGELIDKVYSNKSIFGRIEIGNNVFIGNNVIILLGTTIGDNSIVGAGSVVKGVFQSGSVICGVPSRQVSTVDYFFKKWSLRVLVFDKDKSRKSQIINFLSKN